MLQQRDPVHRTKQELGSESFSPPDVVQKCEFILLVLQRSASSSGLCQTNSQLSRLSVTVTKRRSVVVVVDEISPKSEWIKAQVFKKQLVIPNGDPR